MLPAGGPLQRAGSICERAAGHCRPLRRQQGQEVGGGGGGGETLMVTEEGVHSSGSRVAATRPSQHAINRT